MWGCAEGQSSSRPRSTESEFNPSPNKGTGWGQEARLGARGASCSWWGGGGNHYGFEGAAPPKPAHPTHLAQG